MPEHAEPDVNGRPTGSIAFGIGTLLRRLPGIQMHFAAILFGCLLLQTADEICAADEVAQNTASTVAAENGLPAAAKAVDFTAEIKAMPESIVDDIVVTVTLTAPAGLFGTIETEPIPITMALLRSERLPVMAEIVDGQPMITTKWTYVYAPLTDGRLEIDPFIARLKRDETEFTVATQPLSVTVSEAISAEEKELIGIRMDSIAGAIDAGHLPNDFYETHGMIFSGGLRSAPDEPPQPKPMPDPHRRIFAVAAIVLFAASCIALFAARRS